MITYKSENDKITVKQLKEEISKLSPYKYNSINILCNGEKLNNSEKVSYAEDNFINFIIDEN